MTEAQHVDRFCEKHHLQGSVIRSEMLKMVTDIIALLKSENVTLKADLAMERDQRLRERAKNEATRRQNT